MTGIAERIDVKVTRDFYAIRVFIDDRLHVFVRVAELLSVQAWRDGPKSFSVEYTMRGGTMLTEYDNPDKWIMVLTKLEAVL